MVAVAPFPTPTWIGHGTRRNPRRSVGGGGSGGSWPNISIALTLVCLICTFAKAKILSASGGFAPDPLTGGSAPEPRWGTSVPRPLWPPTFESWRRHCTGKNQELKTRHGLLVSLLEFNVP